MECLFFPFHIRGFPKTRSIRYIAYRLIDPGYQLWNEMGIYQRELSSFDQEPNSGKPPDG